MKRRYILALMLFLACSPALAEWADNFTEVYFTKGIDEAVIVALSEGANPDQIIKQALPLEGMKEEILLKALFCALAQPEAIHEAANKNRISDDTVDKGYQLALIECKRQMEENLNTTIIQNSNFPELDPSDKGHRTVYGSPWKFE